MYVCIYCALNAFGWPHCPMLLFVLHFAAAVCASLMCFHASLMCFYAGLWCVPVSYCCLCFSAFYLLCFVDALSFHWWLGCWWLLPLPVCSFVFRLYNLWLSRHWWPMRMWYDLRLLGHWISLSPLRLSVFLPLFTNRVWNTVMAPTVNVRDMIRI